MPNKMNEKIQKITQKKFKMHLKVAEIQGDRQRGRGYTPSFGSGCTPLVLTTNWH